MLDGLESESAGRVCVMMTAMNVAHLPPALVRSGRVELWLEMKLPDIQARQQILCTHLNGLPAELQDVDESALLATTEGFTGADLKRTVEDAKALYAYDLARGAQVRKSTDYFTAAASAVKDNKQHYGQAEAQVALQQKLRMPAAFRPFMPSRTFEAEDLDT
jgi:ATP-dependent 26S proteasome regulatory subunit